MSRDPAVVSKTMSHIRGKNTGIELLLRKRLTEAGVRYRLYSNKVFGHPDILINKYKIAIFCDSEFWHGYRFEENRQKIHSNLSYWIPKIERNIARDQEVNETLKAEGFLVLRYWGFEILKETDRVVKEILEAIAKRKEIFERKEMARRNGTTLAYLESDGRYLLLHRTKEEGDVNEGKWIGVGGHLEKGETPLQAFKREIREETGLEVVSYRYYGYVDFLNSVAEPERMYVFKVTKFTGKLIECNEGDLEFVEKTKMMDLPMWEGDKVFLPLLEEEGKPLFDLTLIYEGDKLCEIIGPFYHRKAQKKRKKHGKRNHARSK